MERQHVPLWLAWPTLAGYGYYIQRDCGHWAAEECMASWGGLRVWLNPPLPGRWGCPGNHTPLPSIGECNL